MKITIKFNYKLSKWFVFVNQTLFFSYTLSKIKRKYYSSIFKCYFILLRILRQFGLILPLKNIKDY
jgi:hypothetical protein